MLGEDMITVFQYVKDCLTNERDDLFLAVDIMRSNGFKLLHGGPR